MGEVTRDTDHPLEKPDYRAAIGARPKTKSKAIP